MCEMTPYSVRIWVRILRNIPWLLHQVLVVLRIKPQNMSSLVTADAVKSPPCSEAVSTEKCPLLCSLITSETFSPGHKTPN